MKETGVQEGESRDAVRAAENGVLAEPQPTWAPIAIRFAGYTAGLLLALLSLLRMAAESGAERKPFRESGIVEYIQFGLASMVVLLLAGSGWRWRSSAALLWPLASIASIAAIRELDSDLDRWMPRLGWQFPAAIAAILAGMLIYRYRHQGLVQAERWARSPALGILWAGLATVVVFAQLIGQAEFWQAVMGAQYDRTFKRAVEETAETFGYLLLLIGAVEAAFHAAALERQARSLHHRRAR